MGASGVINVWSPDVIQGQLSNAAVFVSSDDASGVNGVAAGWAVIHSYFLNFLHIYTTSYTYRSPVKNRPENTGS